MARYKNFDEALAEQEPITFTIGGRDYETIPDPPAGPILRLIADGKIGDPDAAVDVLGALIGKKTLAEMLGSEAVDVDADFLAGAVSILRRLHEATMAELETEQAGVWDDIAALLEAVDAPRPEPTQSVGLNQLLKLVEWLMDELGFTALAGEREDDEGGDPEGNGSRSLMSSNIGER